MKYFFVVMLIFNIIVLMSLAGCQKNPGDSDISIDNSQASKELIAKDKLSIANYIKSGGIKDYEMIRDTIDRLSGYGLLEGEHNQLEGMKKEVWEITMSRLGRIPINELDYKVYNAVMSDCWLYGDEPYPFLKRIFTLFDIVDKKLKSDKEELRTMMKFIRSAIDDTTFGDSQLLKNQIDPMNANPIESFKPNTETLALTLLEQYPTHDISTYEQAKRYMDANFSLPEGIEELDSSVSMIKNQIYNSHMATMSRDSWKKYIVMINYNRMLKKTKIELPAYPYIE